MLHDAKHSDSKDSKHGEAKHAEARQAEAKSDDAKHADRHHRTPEEQAELDNLRLDHRRLGKSHQAAAIEDDPMRGPSPKTIREASRHADAKQSDVDATYPRYVFKKGTGRKQTDTGLFTAESMIVHKPEEFVELLGRGWCASPAEAGEIAPDSDAAERRGLK